MDNEEGLTKGFDGAYETYESKGRRIKTLDDLVKVANIDLDKWYIDKHIINKWDMQLKGGHPIPMFQVKVWLLPKKMPVIELTVPQVQLSTPSVPKKPGRKPNIRRALFLTDLHVGFRRDIDTGELIPYHDRRALDVCLQVASRFHFNEIIFGGDQLDLPEWTDKYNKGPEFYFTTKPSIIELGYWLSAFMHTGSNTPIRVLEGNHEERLPKMLDNHLIAAYGLPRSKEVIREAFDLQHMLGLDSDSWVSGYPNNSYWLNGTIKIVHGNRTSNIPGRLPWVVLQAVDHSLIYGHNHKMELAHKTVITEDGPKVLTAGSPGCLCRLDYVVPGHAHGQQWQQGFGVIHYTSDDLLRLELVPIHDGRTFYEGYEFTSREKVHELASKFVLEAMNSGKESASL